MQDKTDKLFKYMITPIITVYVTPTNLFFYRASL